MSHTLKLNVNLARVVQPADNHNDSNLHSDQIEDDSFWNSTSEVADDSAAKQPRPDYIA